MVSTPLPIPEVIDSDYDTDSGLESLDGELIYYALRVTPKGKYSYDTFKAWLQAEYDMVARFVIACEKAGTDKEHFHIVFGSDSERYKDDKDVRSIITTWLYQYFGNPATGKFVKGFGNAQYNLSLVEDLDKIVSYTVKDHTDVYYEGFDPEYIKERLEKSYSKKSPDDFKSEYRNYLQEFHTNKSLTKRDFMIRFCQLKAKYGHTVLLSQAEAYARSALIRRDNYMAADMVDNYLGH